MRQEQQIKQKLLIDITLKGDFSNCQDKLANAIDYDQLCQSITTYIEANQFALIETVANNVASLIKNDFPVAQVIIKVAKPHAIKNASSVSITVAR